MMIASKTAELFVFFFLPTQCGRTITTLHFYPWYLLNDKHRITQFSLSMLATFNNCGGHTIQYYQEQTPNISKMFVINSIGKRKKDSSPFILSLHVDECVSQVKRYKLTICR